MNDLVDEWFTFFLAYSEEIDGFLSYAEGQETVQQLGALLAVLADGNMVEATPFAVKFMAEWTCRAACFEGKLKIPDDYENLFLWGRRAMKLSPLGSGMGGVELLDKMYYYSIYQGRH